MRFSSDALSKGPSGYSSEGLSPVRSEPMTGRTGNKSMDISVNKQDQTAVMSESFTERSVDAFGSAFVAPRHDWSNAEVAKLVSETFGLRVSDVSLSEDGATKVTVVDGDNFPLVLMGTLELSVPTEVGYLTNLSLSDVGLLLEANKYLGHRGVAAVTQLIEARSPRTEETSGLSNGVDHGSYNKDEQHLSTLVGTTR